MRHLLLSIIIVSLVGIFMISQSDAQEADTTPPFVNVPDDIVVATTNISGADVEWTGISATDEGVKMHYTALGCDTSRGNTFPVGTTTVTCSATDTAGNVGTASFTITVILVGREPVSKDLADQLRDLEWQVVKDAELGNPTSPKVFSAIRNLSTGEDFVGETADIYSTLDDYEWCIGS